MEFQIDVVEKVARVIGSPVIICGNSDYTIRFTFDEEWLDQPAKTARFKWVRNGVVETADVVFTGSTVAVPVLSNITAVQVGVYAGELQTTTPARVPCIRSILCGGGTHPEPPQDVYLQLLELLGKASVQTPVTLAIEERNTGAPFSFWLGTQAQYDAIPVEDLAVGCLYLITDDDTSDFVTKSDLVDEYKMNVTEVSKNPPTAGLMARRDAKILSDAREHTDDLLRANFKKTLADSAANVSSIACEGLEKFCIVEVTAYKQATGETLKLLFTRSVETDTKVKYTCSDVNVFVAGENDTRARVRVTVYSFVFVKNTKTAQDLTEEYLIPQDQSEPIRIVYADSAARALNALQFKKILGVI